MWIYFYQNSDEVECNLIWCSFKTTSKSISYSNYSEQNCFINNKEVNCSEIENYIP